MCNTVLLCNVTILWVYIKDVILWQSIICSPLTLLGILSDMDSQVPWKLFCPSQREGAEGEYNDSGLKQALSELPFRHPPTVLLTLSTEQSRLPLSAWPSGGSFPIKGRKSSARGSLETSKMCRLHCSGHRIKVVYRITMQCHHIMIIYHFGDIQVYMIIIMFSANLSLR